MTEGATRSNITSEIDPDNCLEVVDTKALIQPQKDKRKKELATPATTPCIPLEHVGAEPVMLVNPFSTTLISSHDTKLNYIKGFTVMQKTGKVVIKGQSSEFKPFFLHVYTLCGQKLVHDKLNVPCKHKGRVGLLSLVISEIEYLAISCSECSDIKLLNLDTRDVIKAFSGETELMKMCEGEGNTLYVEVYDGQVLELDCTKTHFHITKVIGTGIAGNFKGMCYVPSPYRFLVASSEFKELVAVSFDTDAVAWARVQVIFGCDPHGVYYSKIHRKILLADGFLGRILVLDPGTGDTIQRINLPGKGVVKALGLSNDQLVVRSNTCIKKQISFYKLN